MRYTETLLEDGAELLVLGTAQATQGGNWQFSKIDGPCIVSDQSEAALLASYKRFGLLWLLLAVILLLIPGVFLGLELAR
jgi:hypothetical protein